MNRRVIILLLGLLLTALPVLAIMKSNSYKFEKTADSKKCSDEIEELKLCVENSNLTVNSGEPVRIKIFWINTSDVERRIGNLSSDYSVTVNDENGKKLIPVYVQRFMERQEQLRNSGEKDKGTIARVISGSYKGLYAEANGIGKDEIRLTENMYDYDLSAKGNYYVTISKKVPSLEKGEAIEFVLDNIEIQVK